MLQDEDSHHLEWVRPPTDHGVDRPELEAQQWVQVTGTNRPKTYQQQNSCTASTAQYLKQHTPTPTNQGGDTVSHRYGGHSDRETPGPIPNPEAKPASADDTTHTGGKVGHRRTHTETPPTNRGGRFYLWSNERRAIYSIPVFGTLVHRGPFFGVNRTRSMTR